MGKSITELSSSKRYGPMSILSGIRLSSAESQTFGVYHQLGRLAADEGVTDLGHGVQIIAAGRVPPVDLPLREDLRTRLASGPTFALQTKVPPDT